MPRKAVERILMVCACGKEVHKRPSEYNKLKNKDNYKCNDCNRKNNMAHLSRMTYEERSERMKQIHANDPEMSSLVGKKRRAKVKMSGAEMRQRQKESIESDPKKYLKYCEKRKQIALDFHAGMTDDEKASHYSKVFKNQSSSKAENDFFAILKNIGLHFERHQCVSGYFPDGVNHDKKTIVEFYGDMFHCNPRKFTDPSQHCSWLGRTVQGQWDRDKKRLAVFYKNGYNVIIVWESDWSNDQSKQIERITNALHSG